MAQTRTTRTSWSKRIANSFKGVFVGLMLLAAGTILLYWNEGRTVAIGGTIREAREAVIELPDPGRIDPAVNGRLVHASGRAETTEMLVDPLFGVRAVALRLDRVPEFYQWVEHSRDQTEEQVGGEKKTVTTYTYEKSWVSRPVDSKAFNDPQYRSANRVLLNIPPEQQLNPTVTFGAYTLPDFLKRAITGAVPLPVSLPAESLEQLKNQLQPMLDQGVDPAAYVHVQGAAVYLGRSPNAPLIGDVRVNFAVVRPTEVSFIAQVSGSSFEEFKASSGQHFSRLELGRVDAGDMLDQARAENNTIAWVLRLAGLVVIVLSLRIILAPLPELAAGLPPLGRLVGWGMGLMALVVGLVWSLLVMAVAWLRFRPFLGLGLLILAGALAFFFFHRRRTVPAAKTDQKSDPTFVVSADRLAIPRQPRPKEAPHDSTGLDPEGDSTAVRPDLGRLRAPGRSEAGSVHRSRQKPGSRPDRDRSGRDPEV